MYFTCNVCMQQGVAGRRVVYSKGPGFGAPPEPRVIGILGASLGPSQPQVSLICKMGTMTPVNRTRAAPPQLPPQAGERSQPLGRELLGIDSL